MMKQNCLKNIISMMLLAAFLSYQPVYAAAFESVLNEAVVALSQEKAEQGDANAQFMLGNMYRQGKGVSQDYKQAVSWYRKAADQGLAKAQLMLGVMYYEGRGVTQDYKQAVSWYRKAAEQGFAQAQTLLGSMYFEGRGVARDYQQAKEWFIKAVLQGDAVAMLGMGFVAETKSESYAWYTLSIAYGHYDARKYRDDLAKDMTPDLIAMNQERTEELRKILNAAGMK